MEKKLNPTQQMHAFANQRRVLQEKMNTRKPKPELVAFYDIRPGNSMGQKKQYGQRKR